MAYTINEPGKYKLNEEITCTQLVFDAPDITLDISGAVINFTDVPESALHRDKVCVIFNYPNCCLISHTATETGMLKAPSGRVILDFSLYPASYREVKVNVA